MPYPHIYSPLPLAKHMHDKVIMSLWQSSALYQPIFACHTQNKNCNTLWWPERLYVIWSLAATPISSSTNLYVYFITTITVPAIPWPCHTRLCCMNFGLVLPFAWYKLLSYYLMTYSFPHFILISLWLPYFIHSLANT